MLVIAIKIELHELKAASMDEEQVFILTRAIKAIFVKSPRHLMLS